MRVNGKMSNGKFEGLMHISGVDHKFTMVATDQRGSLKRMLNPSDSGSVSDAELKDAKRALVKHLAGKESDANTSGILVDPMYSYESKFLESCEIRSDVGMLMSVEATGYGEKGETAPQVKIFDGHTPDEAVHLIKIRGAAAVKMLVFHRMDSPTHEYQEEMIRKVGEACEKYTIPFLLEPMSHSLVGGPDKKKDSKEFAKIKPDLVIETARELTKPEYGVDVLKSEFPLDLKHAEGQDPDEACRRLDEASQIPWVVLSAGVDYDEFAENVRYAVKNGASGFLAGRAIWKEGVSGGNTEEFLLTTGVKRLNGLCRIVKRYARPWYEKYGYGCIEDVEVVRGE